jgi:YidC/Oxa1 family membrane protein insertase
MDRKSIVVLVVSFALILLWPKLMHEFYPPPPKNTNVVELATNQLAANVATNISTNGLVAATNAVSSIPQINDTAPEQLLVITNEDAIYSFTSRGGGLKSVQLRHYPETIDCGKTTPQELRLASLNSKAPLPALTWLGGNGFGNGSFHLSQSNETIRAERSLSNGLVVIKEFQVSSNYLLKAKVRLENRSGQTAAIPAHEVVIGTATPMSNVQDESPTLGTFWYNGSKAAHIQNSWFANRSFLSCVGMGGPPRTEFQDGASNVVWAAVHNQFFALAVIPGEPAPKVVAREIQLPISTNAISTSAKPLPPPKGIQTSFAYPALNLEAHQGLERLYTIYAGPKEYNALARIGNAMNNNLDAVMDFGFFGFFAKMLLLSMNGLHALGLGYGVAIVAITVIIKMVFWPLTKASTKSMKRMQALQPQMKAIAEKYKDDPMKKNQKTMEFMKEHKVSPLGGCLPMVLQIPVFFGFYTMIRSAIELRGASFLWACDLSQADTIGHIAGFPINVLPLIYGVTLLWSAQLTPVSPGVDPAQQKMMKYMPVMFLLFLYKMAAGLTLYWTVQNLLTIAQMKLTKTKDEPTTGPVVAPRKKR